MSTMSNWRSPCRISSVNTGSMSMALREYRPKSCSTPRWPNPVRRYCCPTHRAAARNIHVLHSRRSQEIGNRTSAAIRAGADGHALGSAAQPPARLGDRAGGAARHQSAGLDLRSDAKERSDGAGVSTGSPSIRTRYSAILPLATTTSWLATQAPATFFRVLVARFTPFSRASSKLFLDEAMISVTLATDDMFGPPFESVDAEPKHPDRDTQKGAIRQAPRHWRAASGVATMRDELNSWESRRLGVSGSRALGPSGPGVARPLRRCRRGGDRGRGYLSRPARTVDDRICLGRRYLENPFRAAGTRAGEFHRQRAAQPLPRVYGAQRAWRAERLWSVHAVQPVRVARYRQV